MEYMLYSHGSQLRLPISRAEYEAIKLSKENLGEVVSVERKFNVVLENYVELEQTVLNLAVRQLVFSENSHNDFQSMRELISRKILNFLSAARLYQNTLARHAKKILDAEGLQQIRFELKDGPHQPMAYRIIVVLRNYSQHDDLPLSSMSISRSWEHGDAEVKKDRASVVVVPKMDTQGLVIRREVKDDVRAELNAMGPTTDVMSKIRKYVEHLGSIHSCFRKLVKVSAAEWEAVMRKAMKSYREAVLDGGEVHLILAGKKNEKGVQLFDEFFDNHRYLTRKNLSQSNLSKYYVRWEAIEKKRDSKSKI